MTLPLSYSRPNDRGRFRQALLRGLHNPSRASPDRSGFHCAAGKILSRIAQRCNLWS
ncbi:MAG: hypothetical protein ACLGQX_09350 [Acidobacteriota bacterium]